MSVDAAELPVAQLREEGRWRSLLDFYLTTMRTAVAEQLQYRVTNYFYMLGMIAEPVIQLVVWTTIADQHGGSVNGITAGEFAAYYIVWTLVRNMNIVFGAPFWECAFARVNCRDSSSGRCTSFTTTSPTSQAGSSW